MFMKKLLFAIAFLLMAGIASAQTTLTFANDVDDKGKTNSDNAKFSIREGNEIKMLVRNPDGFNTSQFQYKIYNMDAYGAKTYSTTFTQDIPSNWVWASKGIIPHSSGYYFIEVVNYSGTNLCEGIFYVSLN
jgi:hypothetical protein